MLGLRIVESPHIWLAGPRRITVRREGLARYRWWRAVLHVVLPDYKPGIVVGEATRIPAAFRVGEALYVHPVVAAEMRRRVATARSPPRIADRPIEPSRLRRC